MAARMQVKEVVEHLDSMLTASCIPRESDQGIAPRTSTDHGILYCCELCLLTF